MSKTPNPQEEIERLRFFIRCGDTRYELLCKVLSDAAVIQSPRQAADALAALAAERDWWKEGVRNEISKLDLVTAECDRQAGRIKELERDFAAAKEPRDDW